MNSGQALSLSKDSERVFQQPVNVGTRAMTLNLEPL
jgi:hypothetical protein